MNPHLSSEEFEQALAGQPSARAAEHARTCMLCDAELADSRSLFHGLRESASATAERYLLAPAKPAAAPRRVSGLAWGFAAAALFVGVMSPVMMHHPVATPAVQTAQAPETSETAIAPMSDDALLNNVQNDLASSVPESLLPLAGTSVNEPQSTSVTQRTTP